MKERDYYFLKEIIFGLREEYVRHKQRLKDFYFKINRNLEDGSPTIFCKFDLQKNLIRELIEILEIKLGFFTYGKRY